MPGEREKEGGTSDLSPLKGYARQCQAGVGSLQNSGVFFFNWFGVDGEASKMAPGCAEAREVGTHPLHGFVT